MVRHIVSWNFKPELSEEERRAAQTELQKHRRSAARTAKTAAGTAAKNTK